MPSITALRSPLVLVLAAAALVIGLGAAGQPGEAARRHTRLVKSVPAKDTVVATPPGALQLWFSEPIDVGVSRVRLTTADSQAVKLGGLTQARAAADSPVTATVAGAMDDGLYTVHWTAASKDGHAVKGSFSFTVKR